MRTQYNDNTAADPTLEARYKSSGAYLNYMEAKCAQVVSSVKRYGADTASQGNPQRHADASSFAFAKCASGGGEWGPPGSDGHH